MLMLKLYSCNVFTCTISHTHIPSYGTLAGSQDSEVCGSDTAEELQLSCKTLSPVKNISLYASIHIHERAIVMRGLVLYTLGQWQWNKNMIGGGWRERLRSSLLSARSVRVRRSRIGGAKAPPAPPPPPPPQFRRPCVRLQHDTLGCPH